MKKVIASAIVVAFLIWFFRPGLQNGFNAIQDRFTTPVPSVQATLAAVQAEATSASQQATQAALDRTTVATTEAMQTEIAVLKTRTAEPPATPVAGTATPTR